MDIESFIGSTGIIGAPVTGYYNTPGYRSHYTFQSGTLPPGLAVTTNGSGQGALSGSPTTTGTYTFTVLATQDIDTGVTATIDTTITITFPEIEIDEWPTVGQQGSEDYIQMDLVGSGEPVTWAVTAGTFPPGMVLNASTGQVTHWPTEAGTFSFTLTATSVANPAYGSSAVLNINVAPGTVSFTHVPLPPIDQNVAYYAYLGISYSSDELVFDLTSGALPSGITVSNRGDVTGTTSDPPGTYSFTIRATIPGTTVSDSWATSVQVTANSLPVITTISLPAGFVYVAYSAPINATGTMPLTWTVISGSLPAGMTMSSNGGNAVIQGTPLGSASASFTVQASNALGTDTQALTLSITTAYEGGTPLPAFIRPRPDGRTVLAYVIHEADGSNYYLSGAENQVFVQAGDTVTVLSSSLPGWPVQQGSTSIDALPLPTPGPSGDVSFTAIAANRNGTLTRTFTVKVTPRESVGDGYRFEVWLIKDAGLGNPLVAIPNPFYPDGASLGTVTGPLGYHLVIIDSDKVLRWGLEFNPGPETISYPVGGGEIFTIPEAEVGDYEEDITGNFGGLPARHVFLTVHISPASGGVVEPGTITVSPPQANRIRISYTPVVAPGLVINCGSPPAGTVGSSYSNQMTVSGGSGVYTISISHGSLPNGLSISPAALITGVPTEGGDFPFTVRVSDPGAGIAEAECMITVAGTSTVDCSITIVGTGAPTIDCDNPPDGDVGVAYSHQLAVSGGTVHVTGGALPDGLTVNASGQITGTPTKPGTYSFMVKSIG